jgi:uncharacterized protein (DUF1501 family)
MSTDLHDCEGCREYEELSRRQFIGDAAMAAGSGVLVTGFFPTWLPQVVLAESFDSVRDVVVSIFLRGGADGLSLCAPFGDANYYTARPTIAVPRPDSSAANRGIALDNLFAFPQTMSGLVPAYQAKNLLVIHGCGSVDPSRSHFDAQRYMEVGKPRDPNITSGWLGRHLATSTPMRTAAPLRALGLSDGLAKTLYGGPKTLPISDPTNFNIAGTASTRQQRADWLRADYTDGPEPVRSAALDALNTIDLLRTIDFVNYRTANGAVYANTGIGRGLRSTAALIKADIGVEAIHIDIGGWDTHTSATPLTANAGMGRLMTELSSALGAFHADVVAGPQTTNVTVVVVSEFGRNVRENSAAGTDHGRATAMFAMGRNIDGGRVLTFNWPGLAQGQLADGQDLKVTIDHRDILAEIVKNRLANTNLTTVFPDYTPTFRGVTR